jgi:hypothetical protein
MDNENTASPTVINCLFINNEATYGGAVDNFNAASPIFINCTIYFNASPINGYAIYSENNCLPTLANCILWNDFVGVEEIYNDGTSTTNATYSNIRGGWPGVGNLNSVPQFVDAASQNCRLQADSPCVESGNNAAIPIEFILDLDNTQRIAADNCNSNPVIDMGAYEFKRQRVGDFNDDCEINLIDFSTFALYWLSDEYQVDIYPPYADGIVDTDDLMCFFEHWLEVYN